MADPLSVTASIAGLVTLADIIFGRLFKYVQAVKGARKEITALSSEVGALYGILNNLHLVSRQLEEQSLPSAPRIHHIGSCQQTLEKLKAILDRHEASSPGTQCVEKFKRKLHWPFSSADVKTLLAEIERHKATLGLALNVDGVSGLLRSLSLQTATRDAVEGINAELKQKHEADTRIAISAKRQSILESFGKSDPAKNQKMSLKLRQPGTGSWLIESQEFQDWCQMKNGKLWLYGIPGAGKTVLASTVIEEVLRGSSVDHAVAFFYCDYKDPETQKPHLVLGSLIQQIAKQDEESFEKVQTFCDTQNPEYKTDYGYDCQELRDLILDITSCFDSATIIVDALDECGSNAAEVTELLASLHPTDQETTIQTLVLSRDEVEIRQYLESYAQVAISARSSDLTLYVGAEIESRIRKNKLRIKDQSLKGYIMEKLVAEADGMFRWVACQMDYMCELPNDSSRRKELGNLPKTLHATYERILRRVNASNSYVQHLVSRTLRWIILHSPNYTSWSTTELCEAVSIDLGGTGRDADSISDEVEILRWCSSLVRRSADGNSLELAHFTVEEFLTRIEDDDEGEFAIFRIGVGHGDIELAKVCLTYLNFRDFDDVNFRDFDDVNLLDFDDNFRDFDDVSHAHDEVTRCRYQQYPLREYAVQHWHEHARNCLGDTQIWSLTKQLLSPSKPGTFMSWVQDFLFSRDPVKMPVDTLIAGTTPLHFAAMLGSPELCAWLIECGCDVNRDSIIGPPLRYNLAFPRRFVFTSMGRRQCVTKILLDAGADPNYYDTGSEEPESLLLSSFDHNDFESATELLKKGAKLDKPSLAMLEEMVVVSTGTALRSTLKHIRMENVEDEHRPRILDLLSKASKSGEPNLLEELGLDGDHRQLRTIVYDTYLHIAAKLGEVELVTKLLRIPKIDLQAAETLTGLTALHYAAMNDNLEIVKLLWTHGAQYSKTDSEGRTAVHLAAKNSPSCLEYFLEQGVDEVPPDNQGATLWHLAAFSGNVQSLDVLSRYLTPTPSLNGIKDSDGWSPLLCAARNGSAECVDWLLQSGCTVMDVANDGSTSLHLASTSGSLRTVQLLLDHGSDINAVTGDGATVEYYPDVDASSHLPSVNELMRLLTARENGLRLENGFSPDNPVSGQSPLMIGARNGNVGIVNLLLQHGADTYALDKAGCNVVHHACFGHDLEILRALRDYPVDWNCRGTVWTDSDCLRGASPLHIAAALKADVLEYLLDERLVTDINQVTHYSASALYLATVASHEEIVASLLSRGADATIKHAVEGSSPIHIAARNGAEAIVSLFLQYKCNVEVLDDQGLSCEMTAWRHGHEAVAEMLREYSEKQAQKFATIPSKSKKSPPFLEEALGVDIDRPKFDMLRWIMIQAASLDYDFRIAQKPPVLEEAFGVAIDRADTDMWESIIEEGASLDLGFNECKKSPHFSGALRVAIDRADTDMCQSIIEEGASLDLAFNECHGCTPLLYALSDSPLGKDGLEIVELLARKGPSIRSTTCDLAANVRGFTALHYAAKFGYFDLLQILLDKDPMMILELCTSVHPFHFAVLEGHYECVELMVTHYGRYAAQNGSHSVGKPRNATSILDLVEMQVADTSIQRPLDVKKFIDFPVELNTSKPLQIAAYSGHVRIARFLLECGASADATDNYGRSALHCAAEAEMDETLMVELLLDYGANLQAVDWFLRTPLMHAASTGKLDLLQVLVAGGADLQTQDRWCQTALHHAADSGSVSTFRSLLIGASDHDLAYEDHDGWTPLSLLLGHGALDEILFAINLAPSLRTYEPKLGNILVSVVLNRNMTPSLLKKLLKRLSRPVVTTLLKHQSKLSGTPLYAACTLAPPHRQADFINMLLEAGADLQQEGGRHGTPLMGACAAGRFATVKLLVSRGAKIVYLKDGTSISALKAARHFPKIVRWLLVERYTMGPRRICQG
ncbi:MAG: hypothetical protein Q9196_003660 [Gyalolechia fulgens]